jgi:hypothetical protein
MSGHRNGDGASEKRRLFARRSRARLGEDRETTQQLAALNAEITLLREENTRLKMAEHQGPGLGKLLAHARALPATVDGHEDAADEAAEMLVEGLVVREALLEICEQIELSMAAVRAKLHLLATSSHEQAPPTVNGDAPALGLTRMADDEAGDG